MSTTKDWAELYPQFFVTTIFKLTCAKCKKRESWDTSAPVLAAKWAAQDGWRADGGITLCSKCEVIQ